MIYFRPDCLFRPLLSSRASNILPLPKKALENTRFFRPEVALEGFLSSRIGIFDLWTKIPWFISTYFRQHPENQGS